MVNKEHIVNVASALGLPAPLTNWSGVDAIMPLLEKARMEGAVVVLKLDGERGVGDNGPYTVLISGGPLGTDFIRADHHDLDEALMIVISRYAAQCWSMPLPHESK